MLANAVILARDQNLTDEAIISRVLLGETEDYEILVRRYNNLLYKTARGILSAENDIEEYTLSSPALSDGQIFIRTDKALYAIGKRR